MKKILLLCCLLICATATSLADPAQGKARVKKEVPAKAEKVSKWNGRRIVFLGNSITEQGHYVRAYERITGCKALNYGIGGTHIARRDAQDTKAFECRVKDLPADADMVIVFGGTNDFGHPHTAPFGKFSDGANPDKITFYAGLHRLFRALCEKYPNKPVVVMTPVHHGVEVDVHEYDIAPDGTISEGVNPTTSKTFAEYVQAIKEVAAFYALPVIDAYSESRLQPALEVGEGNRRYFKDGLHPNEEGGYLLARWMYSKLEPIYDIYY